MFVWSRVAGVTGHINRKCGWKTCKSGWPSFFDDKCLEKQGRTARHPKGATFDQMCKFHLWESHLSELRDLNQSLAGVHHGGKVPVGMIGEIHQHQRSVYGKLQVSPGLGLTLWCWVGVHLPAVELTTHNEGLIAVCWCNMCVSLLAGVTSSSLLWQSLSLQHPLLGHIIQAWLHPHHHLCPMRDKLTTWISLSCMMPSTLSTFPCGSPCLNPTGRGRRPCNLGSAWGFWASPPSLRAVHVNLGFLLGSVKQ